MAMTVTVIINLVAALFYTAFTRVFTLLFGFRAIGFDLSRLRGEPPRRVALSDLTLRGCTCSVNGWRVNGKRSAVFRVAVHMNRSAGAFNDLPAGCQPDIRAFANGFCGEKWVELTVKVLFRDATSGVCDGKYHCVWLLGKYEGNRRTAGVGNRRTQFVGWCTLVAGYGVSVYQ